MADVVSLEISGGVRVSQGNPLDADRARVADNAARDLLITSKRAWEGMPIYHIADNKRYWLKTYPTEGSLTGVVWDVVGSGSGASMTDAEVKAAYENNADTNVFTDTEKSKLASIEDPRFQGTFLSLTALQAAHPTGEAGWNAYVDAGVGQDIEEYAWDDSDNQWKQVSGASTSETPVSIKSKYESNADTNAFTDSEQTKLSTVQSGATANDTDTNLKNRANHSGTQAANTVTKTVAADITHSAAGALTFNLGLFDKVQVNWNAAIDQINISGGQDGKYYDIIFKRGNNASTLDTKLAPNWTKGESITAGKLRIFADSDSLDVYEANADHTAHATDYNQDLSTYWVLKYRRPGGNGIYLSQKEDQIDRMRIYKDGNQYEITMIYA